MSNDEGMTKSECREMRIVPLPFEHSGLFRHSSFVLRHSNLFAFIRVIRGLKNWLSLRAPPLNGNQKGTLAS
jgi:hypothetical protein